MTIHVGYGYLAVVYLRERTYIVCQRMLKDGLVAQLQMIDAGKGCQQPDAARAVLYDAVDIVGLYERLFVGSTIVPQRLAIVDKEAVVDGGEQFLPIVQACIVQVVAALGHVAAVDAQFTSPRIVGLFALCCIGIGRVGHPLGADELHLRQVEAQQTIASVTHQKHVPECVLHDTGDANNLALTVALYIEIGEAVPVEACQSVTGAQP